MPEIQRIDIPQLVRVRKYEIDTERLQNLLREHKKLVGKSNKALAEALDVPVTMAEHWFRTDSGFSIPDAEVWDKLKLELAITSLEFDEAITTFEERPGVYERAERCYFAEGIAPTLTSTMAGKEKIIVEVIEMPESKICAAAMRGRYNEQGEIEEQLYVSDREHANAIVSTQPKASLIHSKQRIRKLTPKECFRLMGFDDADYEKAASVNSNTQLYKQAGNSIVVPVVQHIMSQLLQCGALNG